MRSRARANLTFAAARAGADDRLADVRSSRRRVRRAGGRRGRRRSAARRRPRCRSASSTARRGRAVPGWCADRRRGASRWVAKEWRSACGVALSGRPSAPRSRAIASCTMRGDSGPPLAPTNSGPCGSARRDRARDNRRSPAHRREHRHHARLAALADHGDRIALADRRVGALDRQRLGDAQARRRRAAPARRRRERGPRARAPRPRARSAEVTARRRTRSKAGAGAAPPWARARRERRGWRPARRARWRESERRAESARCSERGRGVGAARSEECAQVAGREVGEVGDAAGAPKRCERKARYWRASRP